MSRHLPQSILASAVLSVVLAAVLIVLGALLARPTIQNAALASVMRNVDLDACAAAPRSWGSGLEHLSMFAYDRSGRSLNPDAPPVEPDLLRNVLETGQAATSVSTDSVISVVPGRDEGPCALVRVSSGSVALAARSRLLGVLAISTLGGMLFAAVGTFWFVVLPLRARVDALAAAARGVGTDSFIPQPTSLDALGSIAEVLSKSHRRVLETQEALEQRNRALEDHLAGIAHDLRTPLSSMQLALEAVAAESEGPLQLEARRALVDVVYLSALVENLHEATRLRHEVDVALGTVELAELVRRLERRFAIVGRHAKVAVAANVPEQDVVATCVPALAERAIANLIQNAVEHNPGPGHVAITLSVVEGGSLFELVVADDGPGLPEASLASLASLEHETFLTERARRRGPGLGMLITAEVARRAGWSVNYEPLAPSGLQVRIVGAVVDA